MHPREENEKPIGRILGKPTKPVFLDKRIRLSEDFTFYGVTKTKNGEPEISLALKIIKANGEQFIIQYHELISPMKFDGANVIEISTLNLTVTIRGKNIAELIDYLAEHRLVWIKEPDSDFIEVEEGECEIEGINVKDR